MTTARDELTAMKERLASTSSDPKWMEETVDRIIGLMDLESAGGSTGDEPLSVGAARTMAGKIETLLYHEVVAKDILAELVSKSNVPVLLEGGNLPTEPVLREQLRVMAQVAYIAGQELRNVRAVTFIRADEAARSQADV